MEKLILVDLQDQFIGEEEKLAVHEKGLLHRAFSIFVCHKGRILLQRRAKTKYHSPGLWTNSCCGHPRVGEEVLAAAERRLGEELGLRLSLKKLHVFHYTQDVGGGLIENEIDHLFMGEYEGEDIPFNPEEVDEIKWQGLDEVARDLLGSPRSFTAWFPLAFQHFQTLKDPF